MAPAEQGLHAGDASVVDAHHGLVVQLELLRRDRPLQVCPELEPRKHSLVHLGLEEPVAALPVALRPVHGGVGVSDQLLRSGRRALRDHRDPDAAAQRQLLVGHGERLGEGLEDAVRGVGRLLDAVDVLEQERKFVAAEARRRVRGADARGEALRDLGQHLVAGRVTEAVVDRLEVVEVEEDDGDALVLASRTRDRVPHPLREERAVGEAGHRIVEGLMGELLLERLPLADVAAVEDDAAHVLVLQQVGAVDLELMWRPVSMHQRALEDLGLVASHRRRVEQELADAVAVRWVEELLEPPPDHVLGGMTEQAPDRGALIADGAVRPDHGDQVARVAHERAEARLAAAAVHLLGERGPRERKRDLRGERPQRCTDGLGRIRTSGHEEKHPLRTLGSQIEHQHALVVGGQPERGEHLGTQPHEIAGLAGLGGVE